MGLKNEKIGCGIWLVVVLLVVLMGYKVLDFYKIGPAVVKKGLNETIDQVHGINNPSAKKVAFNEYWADWERASMIPFIQTSFEGDSFIVRWNDTLHIPVFPSIIKEFRISRVVQ